MYLAVGDVISSKLTVYAHFNKLFRALYQGEFLIECLAMWVIKWLSMRELGKNTRFVLFSHFIFEGKHLPK